MPILIRRGGQVCEALILLSANGVDILQKRQTGRANRTLKDWPPAQLKTLLLGALHHSSLRWILPCTAQHAPAVWNRHLNEGCLGCRLGLAATCAVRLTRRSETDCDRVLEPTLPVTALIRIWAISSEVPTIKEWVH